MADSARDLREQWEAGDWSRLLTHIREIAHRRAQQARLDEDDAEDVASIVSFRCWQLGFVPDDPMRFFETSVGHRILDVVKLRKGRERNVRHIAFIHQTWEDRQNRLSTLDRMVLQEDADRAMMGVRSESDDEVLSYILRDTTGEEVAARTGTNVGVIKMRAFRLRTAMRAMVG